jgi:hypothetical protein
VAKTSGPLLSFRSRGSIGKAMTLGSWKGISYARQYVIPANPRTTAQVNNRNSFRWIGEAWRYAPDVLRAPWRAYVRGKPLTDRNAFLRENQPVLREADDITNIRLSIPVLGGPAPATFSANAGSSSGTIQVSASPPTLPDGWSVTAFHAVALPQQDPHGEFSGPIVAASDTTSPYAVTLTGLERNTEYVVGGFFEFTREDGQTAYGPDARAVVTTT